MKKRVGIYLRVSTDGQTTQNQRRELEAVAARSGWEVVGIYEDAGISGSNGRDKRPGFDQLLNDATARKINIIAAWSVDRLAAAFRAGPSWKRASGASASKIWALLRSLIDSRRVKACYSASFSPCSH
jgi:DNA invertase Pin-like site-specific DNA recombinase